MAEKQFKGIAANFIKAMKLSFIGKGANPNDIIVQDLYNYNPPSGDQRNVIDKIKKGTLDEFGTTSKEAREILSSVLAVYNDHIATKREILTQSRALFDMPNDIVHTVIDVMIDDGFNSFNNEKEEFKIEYILDDDDLNNLGEEYQEQVQNIIDEFIDKFDLKTRVIEMVPELLRDGEYAYGVLFDENNKKGITEIVDDFDVINLLPFYEGEKLAFVINQNHFQDKKQSATFKNFSNSMGEKPIVYKPDNMVFFRLKGPTKLRINMSQFYNNEFKKLFYENTNIRLPKYIRTALPIYYGAIKLIKRLQLMEDTATVLDLNSILKPEIVHVTVPTNTSSVEAQQIIRDYERHLNENSYLTSEDTLDLATLAAQANRRKVLPQWIDSKGTLQSAGINQSSKADDAWDAQDKLRNLIALSIGIPPFYINISGTPIDKSQIIKLYSRYTKKLTSLQKTLADGIKDFLMLHLKHCGLNVSRDNLSVKFKALTSGDSLDDTDMLIGLVAGIGDLYKALDEITASENNNLTLDNEQFKQLFNDLTGRYLNISNLIRIDDNKLESIDGEDGGFEPIGSPSREHGGSDSINGPSMSPGLGPSSGPSAESSYDSFVADSEEIGLPGTEPAVEEI